MRSLTVSLLALLATACDAPADPPAPVESPVEVETSAGPVASAVPSATPSATPTDQPPPDHVGPPDGAPRAPAAPTIYDAAMAQRLRANKGLTLQWIDWNRRGTARVTVQPDGAWRLTGSQRASGTDGLLSLDGVVTEVGAEYFVFDGTITITDTPDVGRKCSDNKVWQFAITQNRPYWRLREFEWCDGLTDYVDIYF